MASARRDDLAKRLAERLDKAPAKGRAMNAGAADTSAPARQRKQTDATARPAARAPARPSTPTTRRQPIPKPAQDKRTTTKQAAASRRSPDVSAHAPVARPRRGAAGTVLRGHLVPDAIHSDARRRKAMLRSRRGGRVTWDDVMCEGLAILTDRGGRVDATLEEVGRSESATARRRLVQATLPAELDRALVDLQLDLGERSDRSATYEQLWSTAIMLWLDATK